MKFQINKYKEKFRLNILGKNFVLNNKNKGKYIYKNKKYLLNEFLDFENIENNEIKIKMILDENCPDKSFMFTNCNTITEILVNSIETKNNSDEIIIQKEILYSTEIFNSANYSDNDDYDKQTCNSIISIISEVTLNKNKIGDDSTISQNKESIFVNIGQIRDIYITNMYKMFYGCKSLKLLDIFSNWKIDYLIDMSYMFKGCSSLSSLPDISNWNINNVIDLSYLFYNCSSLSSLPDLSSWNAEKAIDMSYMFYKCEELKYIHCMLKVKNVIWIAYMFSFCSSLISLPEISKWNTENVEDMNGLFRCCSSMIILPDISNWNTKNVNDMSAIFSNCSSLISMPNISNWNISNAYEISNIFSKCQSLITLPDISRWNTSRVVDMKYMFEGCQSLESLPDISIWDVRNVINMKSIFNGCKLLKSLPDISKWKTDNLKNLKGMFFDCSSLENLPDISLWNFSPNSFIAVNNMFNNCKLYRKNFFIKKFICPSLKNLE